MTPTATRGGDGERGFAAAPQEDSGGRELELEPLLLRWGMGGQTHHRSKEGKKEKGCAQKMGNGQRVGAKRKSCSTFRRREGKD